MILGHAETLSWLLEHSPVIHERNTYGKTPIDMAHNKEILQVNKPHYSKQVFDTFISSLSRQKQDLYRGKMKSQNTSSSSHQNPPALSSCFGTRQIKIQVREVISTFRNQQMNRNSLRRWLTNVMRSQKTNTLNQNHKRQKLLKPTRLSHLNLRMPSTIKQI